MSPFTLLLQLLFVNKRSPIASDVLRSISHSFQLFSRSVSGHQSVLQLSLRLERRRMTLQREKGKPRIFRDQSFKKRFLSPFSSRLSIKEVINNPGNNAIPYLTHQRSVLRRIPSSIHRQRLHCF